MSTDSSQRHPTEPEPPAPDESLAEVIARSQQNYRELIDHLDQALFTLSLTGEIRVANLRLAEILGVRFPELIGHSLGEFVESPSLADAERALPALMERGTWSGTVAVRLKNEKEDRHFSCWLQTVTENGQVVSVTGWARDVSKEYEAQARFSELFESLREGIVFSTPEGKLVDANPALVRLLGYESKEELKRLGMRNLYADPAGREALMKELTEKGEVHDYEIVLRRKDGKKLQCLTSGFAIRDASGRPVRMHGTVVDITERREIERRLHEEQEFARKLVECFPHLIVVLDRKGRFTFVSDRIRDVLGVSPEEYMGKSVGQRTDEGDQRKLAQMHQDIVSGRKSQVQIEIRARHADGTWRSVQVNASPLFDEHGQISGVVSSGQDVTESRRIEQQLAQKEKFTAMGQMMVGAAHELNNPLTAILGVTDLLRERATDDTTRRQVELVLKQARRAATIVQNLLAFSRPVTLGRTRLNLGDVVKEVLLLEAATLDQKKIRVTFDAPRDLPPIEGDRKLLKEVFLNIIANAEQAMPPDRDHGTLAIKLSRVGNQVRVSFTDDGIGIPPESMGKIFDPFFTTKRPGGGSGLGLTICLAVVKEHGGRIEAESAPGSGAAFHVFFPVLAESSPEAPDSGSAAAGGAVRQKPLPAGSEVVQGHSVLVVDDEESIREIIQEGLVARGMKVDAAANSEDALAYLAKNSCDVVLCDFNLPGMSGEKFFESLRSQGAEKLPRFVFMTGELLDPDALERYRSRGAAVLQKPFHVSALVQLLGEILKAQPAQVG
ncbi:MAG TPA: PAS domain S-box protein [Candidatus Acidoferrales bacterium]|nr:PAS domain S-box protein [Candidatus Acidoferrales bacterium]